MDYLRNIPSMFRGSRRPIELVLPFMYSVIPGMETDYAGCTLCKKIPPFAVYAKPLGDRAANLDAEAMKKLSVIYDLILIIPQTGGVLSVYRSPAEDKVIEELNQLYPVVAELSKIDDIPDFWSPINIKNVCGFIASNKDWPAPHVAAFFGWLEVWNYDVFTQKVNLSNPANGEVPLHVAVKRSHLDLVKRLLQLNCNIDVVSNLGDSVFHCAATSTAEIIKELGKRSSPTVNSVNQADQTPLLLACMAAKQECIEALLAIGSDLAQNKVRVIVTATQKSLQFQCAEYMCKVYPDLLDNSAVKFGGTPMHWVKTKAGIMRFIACNVNIEGRNDLGETPLHLMVMRSRLDCAIALLSHNAKIDVVDFKGNTPLHVAVIYGSLEIVKAMVVFGGDINTPNRAGETPLSLADGCALCKRRDDIMLALSIARGSKKKQHHPVIQQYRLQLHDEMKKHGQLPDENSPVGLNFLDKAQNEITIDDDSDGMDDSLVIMHPKRKLRVLCLDGGGIRGLVLIEMLMALEELVDRPLKDCFDWIAGTSTGASVALAVATGKDMKHVMGLYFRLKDRVFVGSRPYSADAFETILQEEFGSETVMTDIKGPKILIPSLLADRHPPVLHFFRNYDHPQRNDVECVATKTGPKVLWKPSEPKEQLVWKAARASGAAPTYFRSLGSFLDGGLMANNPTLDTLTEIFDYNNHLRQTGRKHECSDVFAVLSLGTGRMPMISVPSIDVYWPERIWDAAKISLNASALGRLVVEQACQSEGRVVDRARAWCESHLIPFFRFSPQFSKEIPLDCAHDETLVEMLWETRAYIESESVKLCRLAKLLQQR